MSAAIGVDCVADLISKISSVQALSKKVHHIYSEEELLEKTKGLNYPCAGVIYNGLKSIGPAKGKSGEFSCTVLFLFRQDTLAQKDSKDSAVLVLDSARGRVLETRAPSGHFWEFKVEAAVGVRNGVLGYIQRWACPAQLT